MKQSKPAPLPRSSTTSPGFIAAMAWGLPQPKPRFAPSGAAANSVSEYPILRAFSLSGLGAGPQHDDVVVAGAQQSDVAPTAMPAYLARTIVLISVSSMEWLS